MSRNNKTKFKTTSFYVTISMAFILFLLLLFGMAISQLDRIYGQQKEKFEIDIFFREKSTTSQIKKIEKEIELDKRVNSIQYIEKEKAWANLQKQLGEEFTEDVLVGNPLPNSINLRLKKDYVQLDSIQFFEQNLNEKYEDYISGISYSKANLNSINGTFYKGLWYALGFCSLLLIIAVILINNTIRLAIFSKRFIIRTMQFVGAKSSFIRKPFLINAIIQGIMSSLIAILFYILISLFLDNQNMSILVFDPKHITTNLIIFGVIISIGIIVSIGSTYFSLKKYLKLSQDKLYKL